MMEEVYRVGIARRVLYEIETEEEVTVTSATITIYKSDGTASVSAQTMSIVDAAPALKHTIYYLWTPAVADDYVGYVTYVLNTGETFSERFEAAVVPAVSKYDRYIRTMLNQILDAGVGEAAQLVSFRQAVDCINEAVKQFSKIRPQKKVNHVDGVALTANVWEYALPTDWVNEFSQVVSLEYPVDSTAQERWFLYTHEFHVDELRSKWMFTKTAPGTNEKYRMTYTLPHSVVDGATPADTVPAQWFESVCRYATGLALAAAANRAASTSAPGQAAQYANFRTKQQEYRSQSEAMIRRAKDDWGENDAAGTVGRFDYLGHHGRFYGLG
jgi:hypothetical protein